MMLTILIILPVWKTLLPVALIKKENSLFCSVHSFASFSIQDTVAQADEIDNQYLQVLWLELHKLELTMWSLIIGTLESYECINLDSHILLIWESITTNLHHCYLLINKVLAVLLDFVSLQYFFSLKVVCTQPHWLCMQPIHSQNTQAKPQPLLRYDRR